jgi:hypothetical protein
MSVICAVLLAVGVGVVFWQLHHYADGVAQATDMRHGVTIDGPDCAELGRPFGFHGQKVRETGRARQRGAERHARRRGRKTSILNVVPSQ